MIDVKSTCAIGKTATILSDPWTMLIARDLIQGPKHFCELERSLEGISTRTLAAKLKKLEGQGMVRKMKTGTYAATAKGRGLRVVQKAMEQYGERFL